jgi:hypothetical protein
MAGFSALTIPAKDKPPFLVHADRVVSFQLAAQFLVDWPAVGGLA